MLYRLHQNILTVGLLTLGFLAALSVDKSMSLMSVFTVLAFATQVLLVIMFAQKYSNYSEKNLVMVLAVYTILLTLSTILLANYYDGEAFLLEDPDGFFYYKEGMKANGDGLFNNISRVVSKYDYDDWGALVLTSFLMYWVPSIYFIYAFYVLLGVLTALMLYRIGKYFMPEKYAFLASLAYSTSSYVILFHCTPLKESFFVFLCVSIIYCFYKLVVEGSIASLPLMLVCLGSIAFFRPALIAFFVMAFIAYYAISQRGNAISVFLYVAILAILVVSMEFMQGQADAYTEGGNTEELLAENGSANYSGGFNYFVGWFVAFVGPFPTLFPSNPDRPTTINFLGAGLTYKAFLAIPFLVGCFMAVRKFRVIMIPVVVFVLVEMLASAYVLASFELRKVLLHVPFTYLLSFYGIYELEKKEVGEGGFNRLVEFASYSFAVGVLFLWTVIRVK